MKVNIINSATVDLRLGDGEIIENGAAPFPYPIGKGTLAYEFPDSAKTPGRLTSFHLNNDPCPGYGVTTLPFCRDGIPIDGELP